MIMTSLHARYPDLYLLFYTELDKRGKKVYQSENLFFPKVSVHRLDFEEKMGNLSRQVFSSEKNIVYWAILKVPSANRKKGCDT